MYSRCKVSRKSHVKGASTTSAHLLAEVDFLAHVNNGNLLWGGYNDSSIYIGGLQELGYGNVLIRCPAKSTPTECNPHHVVLI